MRLTKNFTLEEITASDTARVNGLKNSPSSEIVSNIWELCRNLLQPLRDAWGEPLIITSGYRSPKLNALVGGSLTSAHLIGYAVDIQLRNMERFDEFVEFVREWIKDKDFDQCLIETSRSTMWLHLGYKNSSGEQRKQIKNLYV